MQPERRIVAGRPGSPGAGVAGGRATAPAVPAPSGAMQLVQVVDDEQDGLVERPRNPETMRSTTASPSNSGVGARSSIGPCAPTAPRSASTTDSQKRCASRSSRSTDTQAVRSSRPAASIHDRSRTVLPLPAGAERRVMPPAKPAESSSKSAVRATTECGRTGDVRSRARTCVSSHAAAVTGMVPGNLDRIRARGRGRRPSAPTATTSRAASHSAWHLPSSGRRSGRRRHAWRETSAASAQWSASQRRSDAGEAVCGWSTGARPPDVVDAFPTTRSWTSRVSSWIARVSSVLSFNSCSPSRYS